MKNLRNYILKNSIVAAAATLFFACSQEPHFTIEGTVSGSQGKTLYLSHITTNKTVTVDSVKLGKEGSFSFEQPRPECYDFYALQLHDSPRRITIAIDSTETVRVTTTATHFADSALIEGSPESLRLREIAALEKSLQQQVNAILKNSSAAVGNTRETVYNLIGEFKKNIFTQYIAAAPHKASAYYSLFLRLNGEPLFVPTSNRFDSKCFAAVATALNNEHPHATRAIHLYNIAIKGLAYTRPATPRDTIDLTSDKIEKIGLYNIELPDINGDTLSLRSLAGKVVFLDFTLYAVPEMSSRNIKLREIYEKYHERGFEIFQVSFDGNENFWSNSAGNLPWLCVRDGEGLESKNRLLYNLAKLPAFYLINRENEIVSRDNQIEDLEASIEQLLGK